MIDNEGLNGTLKGCCNTLRLRFWTIGSVATASLVSGLCFDEEGGMMIRDGARRLGGTDGALDPRSHRKHRGETVKPRRGAGITPTSHRIAALHTTAVAARARFPLVVAPAKTKKKKRNRLSRCDALWPDCDIKWPGSRISQIIPRGLQSFSKFRLLLNLALCKSHTRTQPIFPEPKKLFPMRSSRVRFPA